MQGQHFSYSALQIPGVGGMENILAQLAKEQGAGE